MIWCNLNTESAYVKSLLNGTSIEISGSDKNEYKKEMMIAFSNKEFKILITKPKIAGFGMNWQHCNNVVFLGLSDSYEQYYQAVRRCWRFGQKKTVNVHIIISEQEGSVLNNIKRKEKNAMEMAEKMVNNMKDISKKIIHDHKASNKAQYDCKIYKQDEFTFICGDSVEEIKKIKDESIDYSIFSPPFAELYAYSDLERDMGNSKNYNQFFKHFKFLTDPLFRIIKPGRLVSIHCIDIPAMKERDGYLGLKDFPGDIIRLFQESGFIYHSRVVIWKNPLVEATRTKALGLMHKQLCKDSSLCRQARLEQTEIHQRSQNW